jgi:hypothetical protein
VFNGESDPRIRLLNRQGEQVSPDDIPTGDSEEFYNTETVPVHLVCPRDHLLMEGSATRPLVVISLFGETRSGKDAFKNGLLSVLENHGLFYRQFSYKLHSLQLEANAARDPLTHLAEQTQAATMNQKHVPLHIALTDLSRDTDDKINVALFNTGGEDNNVETGEDLRKALPFISHTDVFVVMIPPPTLPGLPEHVRMPPGSEGDSTQSRKVTFRHIERLAEAVRDGRLAEETAALKAGQPVPEPAANPIVVFALTKCDRYVDLEGFPQGTLLERRHDDQGLDALDIAMFNEQEALNKFVVDNGGHMLLKQAERIGKVFITAISGTGSDREGHAASQKSALNRCMDPLLLPLMRAGRGRMSQADIEAS